MLCRKAGLAVIQVTGLGWTTGGWILVRQGFIFTFTSKRTLDAPSILFIHTRDSSSGVKEQELKGNKSLPSSVEVENTWSFISTISTHF
jgi:hypothetical protein